MNLQGKIYKINQTQVVSDKFKKKEFVLLDDSSQYPQHVLIQLTQDRVDLLDKYSEGDSVSVSINIRGREWTSPQGEIKYFNTIEAWKIDNEGEATNTNTGNEATVVDDNEDLLPF